MMLPIVDHLCAVQGDVIHAVPFRPVAQRLRTRRGRSTFDTVCGRQRARLYACDTASKETGDPLGRMPLAWAPPARWDTYTRCWSCWSATGKPRPAGAFTELRRKENDRAR